MPSTRSWLRCNTITRVEVKVKPSMLQYVAVCCSVLQCVPFIVVVQYNYTWWRWSEAECVAVCYSVLHCVAVRCSLSRSWLQCNTTTRDDIEVKPQSCWTEMTRILSPFFRRCFAVPCSIGVKICYHKDPLPPTHTHNQIHIGTSITYVFRDTNIQLCEDLYNWCCLYYFLRNRLVTCWKLYVLESFSLDSWISVFNLCNI